MTPTHLDPVGSARSQADCANARIRALYRRAHAECRDLTAAERAEYERLRAVYVRAMAA